MEHCPTYSIIYRIYYILQMGGEFNAIETKQYKLESIFESQGTQNICECRAPHLSPLTDPLISLHFHGHHHQLSIIIIIINIDGARTINMHK